MSAGAMPVGAHAVDATLKDIAGKLPVKRHGGLRTLWLVCMAIGLVTFAVMLFTDAKRAWGSYAINSLYWLGIANGAMVLACAIRLSNGRWAGPIIRIAESTSAYYPFGIAFMLVLLIFGSHTYLPWLTHVEPRQAPYLNLPFLVVRTVVGLGLLWWLGRDIVRVSLRTDAHLLKNHVAPELKPRYEKLAEGWRGDAQEVAWQRDRLSKRSPQMVLAFAIFSTLFAWDWVMSLTPEWTSTLFGWWYFMGAFLSGIAMTAFLATRVRTGMKLESYITPLHFWDVGKLIFGFSIFWAYEFWAQYLPIWYANLPDETWWVFLRFEEPWRALGMTVFTFVFLLPFCGLMNMATKKSSFWLALFSLIVLSGMWLERHVLVMPSLEPDKVWVGLPEIGVTIGFLGVFGWAVQGFMTKYPTVKVADVLDGGGRGH